MPECASAMRNAKSWLIPHSAFPIPPFSRLRNTPRTAFDHAKNVSPFRALFGNLFVHDLSHQVNSSVADLNLGGLEMRSGGNVQRRPLVYDPNLYLHQQQ